MPVIESSAPKLCLGIQVPTMFSLLRSLDHLHPHQINIPKTNVVAKDIEAIQVSRERTLVVSDVRLDVL